MMLSTFVSAVADPATTHATTSIAARMPACARLLMSGLLILIASPLFAAADAVGHELNVKLRPDSGELHVTGRLHFDTPVEQVEFILNAGFTVASTSGTVTALGESADRLRQAYRATLPTAADSLELHYHGRPVFSAARGHGGMPPGTLGSRGVYLDGASAWYPLMEADVRAVRLRVQLPEGWQSVSVGRRTDDGNVQTWSTDRRHDDIYLLADRFTRYTRNHDGITLSVYLLEDEPALATRYLDALGGYIDHYSDLIGDYPYGKFAVVENRWQTGYGMPSFTLLGSRVLRLPFIVYTSLPHEILHNWWGNGVWVDYAAGNWSEGLTAYLADHWMQERRGKGAAYRLKALQRYSNFAARGPDAPLLEFVSRHNDASQSLGYSKSLMVYHMLRLALGDEAFVAGLRRLWREHAFERIGFVDVVRTLAGDDSSLAKRFVAWLALSGAPRLALEHAEVQPAGDGWRLALTLAQQQDSVRTLDVPVAVMLDGETLGERRLLSLDGRRQRFELRFTQRPLRVDIDPEYDVLRVLDATEQPPALNRLFGSRRTWLVLPGSAPEALQAAWQALADAWSRRYPGLKVIRDEDAGRLPAGDDRLILGWDNRLLPGHLARFARDDQTLENHSLRLGADTHPRDSVAVVVVGNNADGVTSGFIGAPSTAAVSQLARKLPHYGSYGRLVFDHAGNNVRKDTLTSVHSTLTRQLGREPTELRLPPRAPLGASPAHARDTDADPASPATAVR